MKTSIALILSVILFTSCSPRMSQEMQQSTITYQALSRGFYLNVEIKGSKLTIIRERETLGKNYTLSYPDIKEVSTLYQKIKLDELADYKAPTEKRFNDGAAIANLNINYQGKTHNSQGFDHENPPIEIAEFVNKIVSFTKN